MGTEFNGIAVARSIVVISDQTLQFELFMWLYLTSANGQIYKAIGVRFWLSVFPNHSWGFF
jgi:hypothetical protein